METIKEQFLNYLKDSLVFKNMLSDRQNKLLEMAESSSEEQLTIALQSLKAAEEQFKADQSTKQIDIEAMEKDLSTLNGQLKVLNGQELKIDEKEENEEDQVAAEAALKQLDGI